MVLGPPRSGTTFLQKKLCELSNGIGIYEPTGISAYQGVNVGINPYDSIFGCQHQHIRNNPGAPIVVKEVLDGVMISHLASQGHDLTSWIDFRRLRSTRIIWIFRHPIEVWRSIVAQGWDRTYHPIDTYISFYADAYACYQTMKALAPTQTTIISYERLIQALNHNLKLIAQFAALPVAAAWDQRSEDKTAYYRRVYYDASVKVLMEEQDAHASLHNGLVSGKAKPTLDDASRNRINARLLPLYEQILAEDLLA